MKVGYSKTYPILASGQWEKIWIEDEIALGAEEDVRKTLYSLKKQVENFHYESNKAAEKQTGTQIYDISNAKYAAPEMAGISMEDQIKSCKEVKVLESYKIIVKGKPELETAYNNRLKELT